METNKEIASVLLVTISFFDVVVELGLQLVAFN
jgi:hypothetical protein